MTEYEKFKKLLEYFVAHLEWCVNKDKNHIGYINYIKPLIDKNTFKYTGQGYSSDNIQQQIKSWCFYENGLIHINIQQNFGKYKSTKCYLNWDWTGLNVNAKWTNDHIKSLYLNKYAEDTGNNVLGVEKALIDLGLFDNKPPNNNLIALFDRYNSLIIDWKIMEELKKYEHLVNVLKDSKNVILTGAPGTGKTYLAKQIAKQMIGVKTDDELEESVQFNFVQFHPSYDYTDFIEGLRPTKPDSKGSIGFELKNGIFKSFSREAIKNFNDSKKSSEELNKEEVAKSNIKTFLDDCIEDSRILTLKNGNNFQVLSYDDNKINVHAPENAITSELVLPFNEILEILIEEKKLVRVKDVRDFFKRSHNRQSDSYIFTLFEQKELNKDLKNDFKVPKIERKNFVFVIDEINRGEISKIFGELFFSIDPSYRGKKGSVKTQYSNLHNDEKEVFYVPENVYIIGSMNDIDRSVESFDFAMRRRFTWIEITAEQSADNMNLPKDLKERMFKLNEQISKTDGLNSSYHIGAAYFLDSNGYARTDIESIWNLRIVPLLKEYLRGIPDSIEKIQLLKNAFSA
jgi:hypothetical protein